MDKAAQLSKTHGVQTALAAYVRTRLSLKAGHSTAKRRVVAFNAADKLDKAIDRAIGRMK